MEYEDYTHMLKKVFFACVNNQPYIKSFFSLDRVRTVLEVMTLRSSSLLSLIGSIASGNLIPQSTPKINTAVDSPTTPVADCSVQQS
jgi:hypothetical protein